MKKIHQHLKLPISQIATLIGEPCNNWTENNTQDSIWQITSKNSQPLVCSSGIDHSQEWARGKEKEKKRTRDRPDMVASDPSSPQAFVQEMGDWVLHPNMWTYT